MAVAVRYFGIKDALIVIMAEERTIESEGVTMQVLPAWRWMGHCTVLLSTSHTFLPERDGWMHTEVKAYRAVYFIE